ncbi:DUF1801 domain-containing protein [Saccharopolyspora erythraea]|uniref:DUF1801 domain-containing protein n=1 Tax=Saccharopolyspora erythraea TaxID=1836 RepID=UPI001BA970FD|nr:DUF1801 domain-containing protein [Saccharopolyspora erythraea]
MREWLDGLDEQARAQARELAALVLGTEPRVEHAVKWGRLTFTVDGDWHHWVCAVAATARGARLVFHKGVLLDDPEGLLTGSGRYVREVSASAAASHPDAVSALLRDALAHRTDLL